MSLFAALQCNGARRTKTRVGASRDDHQPRSEPTRSWTKIRPKRGGARSIVFTRTVVCLLSVSHLVSRSLFLITLLGLVGFWSWCRWCLWLVLVGVWWWLMACDRWLVVGWVGIFASFSRCPSPIQTLLLCLFVLRSSFLWLFKWFRCSHGVTPLSFLVWFVSRLCLSLGCWSSWFVFIGFVLVCFGVCSYFCSAGSFFCMFSAFVWVFWSWPIAFVFYFFWASFLFCFCFFVLFCFILFLFYSVLFYFVLFYCVFIFCFVLFCFCFCFCFGFGFILFLFCFIS